VLACLPRPLLAGRRSGRLLRTQALIRKGHSFSSSADPTPLLGGGTSMAASKRRLSSNPQENANWK
jgi:hypothetical protein